MVPPTARIVVAEGWSILRLGLSGLLHGAHTVVAQLEDPRNLPDLLGSRPVDLVLVGDAPDLDLQAMVRNLHRAHPGVAIAVLCDHLTADALRGVLQAGATGVFTKRLEEDDLLHSLDRILRGDRVIDQHFLPLLFGGLDRPEVGLTSMGDDLALTPRERQVLSQLARGCTNRQIADALVVGESTVKSHLASIYAKLEVNSRHHAVGRALELGVLS